MHLPASLLPSWMLFGTLFLWVLTLAVAVYRAQWAALAEVPERMHLVAGGALACLLLWLLNIHLVDGLLLHFLGVTTLTLVVGWSFGVLGASTALLGLYLVQGMDWSAVGLSACLTIVLPASASRLLAVFLYRPRLRHPFVYILGAGFAGGALGVLLVSVVTVVLLALAGEQEHVVAALTWWPLVFLIMFSEGFINGMCVSALAVFRPDVMKTFDDRFYLDDENRPRR